MKMPINLKAIDWKRGATILNKRPDQITITWAKLLAVNLVLIAGAVVIVMWAWPEFSKPMNYGGPYVEGPVSTLFLALIETGIPTLIFLAFGHVLMTHFLFAEGEISEYRARRRIETMAKFAEKQPAKAEQPKQEERRSYDD